MERAETVGPTGRPEPSSAGGRTSDQQVAYSFADGAQLDQVNRTRLLGGKGAAQVRMVSLGLPVPPGFTLTTAASHRFLEGGWTAELDTALDHYLADLQIVTGRHLGDRHHPLVVSVRSGAAVSMPGMMDTVLNVGMTPAVAEALTSRTGHGRFGWDTLRRFVSSYASVVLDTPPEVLRTVSASHLGPDDGRHLDAAELEMAVVALVEDLAGRGLSFPDNPRDQVRAAVRAVFGSWRSERAVAYRRVEGIDDSLGTAVTVQMMVFGNHCPRSGSGVVFSRDPSTGTPGHVGEFLPGAQGEDVVAGTHQLLSLTSLAERWPDVAEQLEQIANDLEHDLADLVDLEFTVEDGALWLLQARPGKRSPRAALRIAIDMAEDPGFPLTRAEAVQRVANVLADPPTVARRPSEAARRDVLVTGLPASPGSAIGVLCTDVDSATDAGASGDAVILARRETSPADIAAMAVARGIVTAQGGLVSHAAVVARSWGLPAIVGVDAMDVRADGIALGDVFVANGTEVTVNGTTGELLRGAHADEVVEAPEVAVLRAWQHR